MYTSHGHEIPNSAISLPPEEMLTCGGIIRCVECKVERDLYNLLNDPRELKKVRAMELVRHVVEDFYMCRGQDIPDIELHVIEFVHQESSGVWYASVQTIGDISTEYRVIHLPAMKTTQVSRWGLFDVRNPMPYGDTFPDPA